MSLFKDILRTMRTDKVFITVVCYHLMLQPCLGATVRLSGSPYAELGQTFRFTCTVTDDTTPTLGTVAFSKGTLQVSFSSPSCGNPSNSDLGYSRVTCGSSGVYYMDISNVSLQDATTWTCTRRSDRSNNVILPVYYGPYNNMTLDKSSPQTVIEATTLTVTCSATCNPCRYTWKKGTTTVSTSRTLSLTNINRNQAGDYICTATNTQTGIPPGSSTLSVTVQYTPTLTGIASSYLVSESSALQINCSRYTNPGDPSTTSYRWTGPGSYISTGPVLAISSISRSQTGQYRCTATNILTPTGLPPQTGSAAGQFQVDVQYPASITSFTVNTETNTVTVSESEQIVMRCQVDSNPNSTVKLYNGSSELSGADNSLTHEHSWTSTCRQRGIYSCTASNGIGSPVTRRIGLFVNCSPRLESTYDVTTHYSSIGSNTSLAVPFLSYPEPDVVWGKTISQRNLSSISYVSRVSDVSVTAFLSLIRLQQEDLGEYMIQASNGVGQSVKHTLQLVLGSSPTSPTNLSVVSQTKTSLLVSWRQEFNGGGNQTFTVEYSPDNISWKESRQIIETDRDIYLQMNITGLTPQTVYYVRVAARNQYGTSYTDSVRTLTQKAETAAQAPAGILAGVIVGVLVIVAVIVTVILLVRRGFKCVILQPGSIVVKNVAEEMGDKPHTSSPAQGIPSANPYAELSEREPDRTAYTELKTYENTGLVADVRNTYEEFQSRPSENKTHYEDIKPAAYENLQRNNKDVTTPEQSVHEGNLCLTPVDNEYQEPHTYITVI